MKMAIVAVGVLAAVLSGALSAQEKPAAAPTVSAAMSPADKAAVDAAARALLRAAKLVESTKKLYNQLIPQMMGQIQRRQPDMPGRAFDIIEEELERIPAVASSELHEFTVAMYIERFTVEEMNKIVAFYRSDVGQKAQRELADIGATGVESGRKIGLRLGSLAVERAVKRIQEEGLELKSKP